MAGILLTGCVDAPIDADGDGWSVPIDCDDANGDIHEAAHEVCNDKDDNCDGFVDEGVNFTYYLDADGDTYGTAATSIFSCEPTAPEGYTDNTLDYDDLDESVNILTWYEDGDGDGYGDAESFITSEATGSFEIPDGYVENDDDCDDTDPDANIDKTWYHDADGDGYGNGADSLESCLRPDGYVTNSDDWNDSDATVYPGAPEICDDQDNDGNDLTDDEDPDLDTSTASTWYADADADGYGDAGATKLACDQPEGYVDNDYDFDDTNENVNILTWYIDTDDDGYGVSTTTTTSDVTGSFSTPAGYSENADDCDDGDASVNILTWYFDGDGDGYGDADDFTTSVTEGSCTTPAGYVDNDYDYNDTDDAVNILTWYIDTDGDGYGVSTTTTTSDVTGSFSTPSGYADTAGDCDDTDNTVNPGAVEDYTNGIDDDCDGTTDDEDGDGYTISDGDCDDTDPLLNPGTVDTSLDGVSVNCSGNEEFFSDDFESSIVGDAGDNLGSANTLVSINITASTGASDLVVGVPDSSYSGPSAGAVVALLDDTTSFPTSGTSVYDLDRLWYGDNPGDRLGFPISYGGKTDDGTPFEAGILVGAQGASTVYLISGESAYSAGSGAQSIGASASVVFTGVDASAVAAFDGDGDGIDDAYIGDESASAVYLYSGSGGIDSSSPDYTLTTSGADAAGHAIYPYRDVDGDGYVDVLIPAPEYDGTYTGSTLADSGRVYLLFGPVSGGNLDDVANFIWEGDGAGDELGENAHELADTNGDNLADILITSANVAGTGSYQGAAYYFDGATAAAGGTALASDTDTTFWASSGDGFGPAITGPETEFTGDDYADYCLGSPQNSDYAAASGQVYCIPGNTISSTSAYLDSLTGITRAYGSDADDYFGTSVLLTNLIDDGIGDLAVGAPGAGSGGTVFLVTE